VAVNTIVDIPYGRGIEGVRSALPPSVLNKIASSVWYNWNITRMRAWHFQKKRDVHTIAIFQFPFSAWPPAPPFSLASISAAALNSPRVRYVNWVTQGSGTPPPTTSTFSSYSHLVCFLCVICIIRLRAQQRRHAFGRRWSRHKSCNACLFSVVMPVWIQCRVLNSCILQN
jgi:hypothetical protein